MSQNIFALLQQGKLARRENRYADAQRDFSEAIALGQQNNLRVELIEALKGLGQIERDIGNCDTALTLYKEAVAICRHENNPLQLAHTIRHVGDIYQDINRVALAEECYQEALAIYRTQENTQPLDLANAIRPYALLKDNAGDRAAAKPMWEEARELYALMNVQEGVAECMAHLST